MAAAGSGGTAGRLVTYEINAATGEMKPLEPTPPATGRCGS